MCILKYITAAETDGYVQMYCFGVLTALHCGMLAFGCALTERFNFPAVHFNKKNVLCISQTINNSSVR